MKPRDKAYIAGFFDGEGCVYRRRGQAFRINIAQSEPNILRWIQDRLGYGRVYGPYARNQYTLTIARKADMVDFATLMIPYCRVKKAALKNLVKVIQ